MTNFTLEVSEFHISQQAGPGRGKHLSSQTWSGLKLRPPKQSTC